MVDEEKIENDPFDDKVFFIYHRKPLYTIGPALKKLIWKYAPEHRTLVALRAVVVKHKLIVAKHIDEEAHLLEPSALCVLFESGGNPNCQGCPSLSDCSYHTNSAKERLQNAYERYMREHERVVNELNKKPERPDKPVLGRSRKSSKKVPRKRPKRRNVKNNETRNAVIPVDIRPKTKHKGSGGSV